MDYFILARDFPDTRSCGLHSAIFLTIINETRLIIPKVLQFYKNENFFEITVYKLLAFINAAINTIKRYISGFCVVAAYLTMHMYHMDHLKIVENLLKIFVNLSVKLNGKLVSAIPNRTEIKLGGYLNWQYGIVICDEIFVRLIWADDLVSFSDTKRGSQKVMNGLQK